MELVEDVRLNATLRIRLKAHPRGHRDGEIESLVLKANNVGNSFPCQETKSQGAYDTRKRVLAMGLD